MPLYAVYARLVIYADSEEQALEIGADAVKNVDECDDVWVETEYED